MLTDIPRLIIGRAGAVSDGQASVIFFQPRPIPPVIAQYPAGITDNAVIFLLYADIADRAPLGYIQPRVSSSLYPESAP